jgi:hypothetical protein
MLEDLCPSHLTPVRKTIVEAIYGLLALGIQSFGKKRLKDLLPPVLNGGKVIGSREINEKGPNQPGISDP